MRQALQKAPFFGGRFGVQGDGHDRHRSIDTLRGYVRDAELFKDHAGAELALKLRAGTSIIVRRFLWPTKERWLAYVIRHLPVRPGFPGYL